MTESGLIPLGFMQPGESGTLVEIKGLRRRFNEGAEVCSAGAASKHQGSHGRRIDRGHRLEHRLQHMGLSPGQTVTVVQNALTGPVIVAVKDTRIGIARGIASRLYVRPHVPDDQAGLDPGALRRP
ncbi:MAG: FeoA family protein [Candidatus Geothermincolia bacterium]